MKIKLTPDEIKCLLSLKLLDESKIGEPDWRQRRNVEFEFNDERADEIRERCIEQLQVEGFDRDYELTATGKLLDSMIDKFFVK